MPHDTTAGPAPTEKTPERRAIVHAMQRLLAGTPLRSDGRLTVVSLAAEANVKRYVLTEKHTDLKDLFYARIRAIDRGTAVSENSPELQRMRDKIADLTRETDQQRVVINALARTVQALQCKLSAANPDGGVSPRPSAHTRWTPIKTTRNVPASKLIGPPRPGVSATPHLP